MSDKFMNDTVSTIEVDAEYLKQFGYHVNLIKLISLILNLDGLKTELVEEPEAERIHSYMTAGDEARNRADRGDFIAALPGQVGIPLA